MFTIVQQFVRIFKMAEARSMFGSIVLLNESNFATWKIQIKMALIREELWSFVAGDLELPKSQESKEYRAMSSRRDKALSIIVMAIEPKLLYLIGDPVDPKIVFEKLCNVFQRKSWANKLRLRKRLYSLKLEESSKVHEHLKNFTEIFNELAVLGDVLEDEDLSLIHI